MQAKTRNKHMKGELRRDNQASYKMSHKSSQYKISAGPLPIAFGDDLPCDKISSISAGGVVINHIDATTRSLRQPLQNLHVDLLIMDTYEGKDHERAASEMLTHKPVYSLSVLEAAKQIG
jgi:hypothetical protein